MTKRQENKQRSTKHSYKTTDRRGGGGGGGGGGGVCSSCSTNGTRRVKREKFHIVRTSLKRQNRYT